MAGSDSYQGVAFVLHKVRELPLMWFLVGCVVARMGLLLMGKLSPEERTALLRKVALAAGLLVLLTYVGMAVYSLHCYMLQADEANILGVAAASHQGLPMYVAPGSADSSYALMYGPVTFLIYRAGLAMGGIDHYWVLRGMIVAANLGWLAALYLLLRKFVSVSTAVALMALPASIMIKTTEMSLGMRADMWITLLAALTILCSFLEAEVAALVLTGVLGGLMVDLKITSGTAMLFPLLVLYRRFGLRALVALPIAAAVALAPFAVANISLRSYMAWILFTRSEGISPAQGSWNFIFAVFLLCPCVLMEMYLRSHRAAGGMPFRQRRPELLVILLCLAAAVVTSKPGTGPWYMWHIIPSVMVYLGLAAREMKSLPLREQGVPVYTIAVACLLLTCVNLPRALATLKGSTMSSEVGVARQAVDRYLDVYQGRTSIQMGVGSINDDVSTSLRYVLVYKGQPYTLEGSTGRFETLLMPFPSHVLTQMASCKDDVWLVPHGQQPFDVYVFPEVLRTTFLQNYRVERSDEIYDVWGCKRAVGR